MAGRRNGTYSTQWHDGRRWMTAADCSPQDIANSSIDGIKTLHKRCRLVVHTEVRPDPASDRKRLATLVIREWDKAGKLVFENEELAYAHGYKDAAVLS